MGGWRSVFAVPSEVVDKHLRTAGPVQLKVLLYLLRHSEEDITPEELGAALGCPACDVMDAAEYWAAQAIWPPAAQGILPLAAHDLLCIDEDGTAASYAASARVNPVIEPVAAASDNNSPNGASDLHNVQSRKNRRERIRYGYGECADILRDDPELRHMLTAIEAILGKQLNHTEVAAFVTMRHWYGMPSECIAVIAERCKSIGKSSVNYIEATVVAWADEEINTLELVHRRIEHIERQKTAWNAVRLALEIPERAATAKENLCCDRWVNEYGTSPEMIRLAYERCVDKKGKMSVAYMDGIIKNWLAKGITTPEQAVENDKPNVPPERKSGKAAGTFAPTYDKDEIEAMLDEEWLDIK